MKRLLRVMLRWVMVLLIIAGLTIATAIAAYVWWLPGQIHTIVQQSLADAGWPNASVTLKRVTLGEAELTDLRLDESDGFAVANIIVRYHWRTLLLDRQFDELIVHGLRWRVVVTDGHIDLGPLASLFDTNAKTTSAFPVKRLRMLDTAIDLHDGPLTWHIPVQPGGWLELDDQAQALRIDMAMQSDQTDHMLARLFHTFTGYHITGGLSLKGTLSIGPGERAITATLRDATVQNADGSQQFHNLTGQITLDAFSPPTTPGGQRIAWQSAKVGQLDIDAGTVQLRLEPGPRVHVELLQWRIGQGRYWAHAFDIQPNLPDLRINLFWENIALADWLTLITGEHATGSGRLFGRLPIRVQTQPQLKLTFGEGYLISSGPGHVTIEDRQMVERMVGQYAGQVGGEGDIGQMVQTRLVQSLQDYQYEELEFVVRVMDGEPALVVRTHGKGRNSPQEIDLNVTFHGIGPLVDLLMRAKLGMDQAKDRLIRESLRLK